jgi:hypothetical protein
MQTWRPPYPSENLKTPRFVQTYSTTNPYAVREQPQGNQNHQHQQQQPQGNQNQQSQSSLQGQFQELKHSKRENNSDKIYERGLTPQVGMNPFLQGNNYIQDLETQNEFLKPMNSNIDSK